MTTTTTRPGTAEITVNGTTVDLVRLVGTFAQMPELERASWVSVPASEVKVGEIAYADCLGDMRRGIVVKVGKTRISVALTTQGAVDEALRYRGGKDIRVQDSPRDQKLVRVFRPGRTVEPAAAPVEEIEELDIPVEMTEAERGDHELALAIADELEDQDEAGEPEAQTLALGEAGSGKVVEPESEELAQRGSEVIRALEDLWSAFRRVHPELPNVIIITGANLAKWGHTGHDRWDHGDAGIGHDDAVRTAKQGATTEVFISGERLACGAKLTTQTFLHEAAHVLAHLRGEKDTSRQNRYHNRTFVKLAEELGLEWPAGAKPDTSIGFSDVRIRPETVEKYRAEIEALGAAIKLYVPLHPALAALLGMNTTAAGGDGETEGGEGGIGGLTAPKPPKVRRGPKARNLSVATCGCEEPRKLRIAPKTLEKGPVACGLCKENFEYRDQADEDQGDED